MPTPDNQTQDNIDINTVSVIINGKAHSSWTQYSIDSDFLTPADAWSVSLGIPDGIFPDDIAAGMPVTVQVGNDTVLDGRIDRRRRSVRRGQTTLSLNGRDKAGMLYDCSAPIFTAKQLTLEEIVASIVRPFGITKIRIDAEATTISDKISVEPGVSAWEALTRAAKNSGLWPWFDPDGTLVIGGADYTMPPVASLIMRFEGDENNVISIDETTSIEGSFSELTLLGQGHAQRSSGSSKSKDIGIVDISSNESSNNDYVTSSAEIGSHNMKVVVSDLDIPFYRPKIATAGDIDNIEQLRYQARKMLSDAKLNAFDLVVEVRGHRTSDDVLWSPGQRIHVISEPHDIDSVYFLMSRTFIGGRNSGTYTVLGLKQDGVWIPDAYKKKKEKRKAKKGSKKGKKEIGIVDIS
ncbi:phage baseplate assembly protein [Limnobaculum xujianqingii]|uniref:phage baseplate assembly protein n=1 Tax=Limnobaculum xujianqingii TaxID=2738837 RepID=UPI0015BA4DE0|nr:phage tail protein [Limnobaculum xujianqingii]